MVETVATRAKTCLGNEWSVGRNKQTDGTTSLRILGEKNYAYVEVRPSKSLYSRGWNVHLDVLLDEGSCNAKSAGPYPK